MFSYRHAYHAGNHADLLKHLCLVSILGYLRQKETALSLIDTHAGTGLYDLRGRESQTSGEARLGIEALRQALAEQPTLRNTLPEALRHYLQAVQRFGRHYPGSPCLMRAFMRPQDSLKAFELLGADARALERNFEKHRRLGGCTVATQVLQQDGFARLKRFLPPPSRRGFILIDPGYELKTDYRMVEQCVADALTRFVTGCFMVWYPIIARHEAHNLPKRLKTLTRQRQRPWLQVSLGLKPLQTAGESGTLTKHSKLSASAVLVINPPHTLKSHLRTSLPVLVQCLQYSQTCSAHFEIDAHLTS